MYYYLAQYRHDKLEYMLYYGIIDKVAYFELESVLEARRELFTMCKN